MYDPEGAVPANPEKEEKKKKKKRKKDKSKRREREAEALQASAAAPEEAGHGGNGNGGYVVDDGGFNQPQQPLRIAIRTQPGAQVSITPGHHTAAPPQPQHDQHDSTETEI